MEKELACPIKQVAFAGIHMRGGLVFISRLDELLVLFIHFSQQVVQFRGVFLLQESLDQLLSL